LFIKEHYQGGERERKSIEWVRIPASHESGKNMEYRMYKESLKPNTNTLKMGKYLSTYCSKGELTLISNKYIGR
jgi:hypothetical protein